MAQVTARLQRPMRLMLLGSKGVGKSALCRRFLEGKFSQEHDPTTLLTSYHKDVEVNGEKTRLEVYDVPGLDDGGYDISDIVRDISAEVDGLLFVVSISSKASIYCVSHCHSQLVAEGTAIPPRPCIIVANKNDEEPDGKFGEMVTTLQSQTNAPLVHCSTKLDMNVSRAFNEIAKLIQLKEKERSDASTEVGTSCNSGVRK